MFFHFPFPSSGFNLRVAPAQNWAAGAENKISGRNPVLLTRALGQGTPQSRRMKVGSPCQVPQFPVPPHWELLCIWHRHQKPGENLSGQKTGKGDCGQRVCGSVFLVSHCFTLKVTLSVCNHAEHKWLAFRGKSHPSRQETEQWGCGC